MRVYECAFFIVTECHRLMDYRPETVAVMQDDMYETARGFHHGRRPDHRSICRPCKDALDKRLANQKGA